MMLDSTGREICPGDLLRSLHFIGARRKRHWLYHVAVRTERGLDAVPACHLEPSLAGNGGRCWIHQNSSSQFTIISGHGPGEILSFEDRPRAQAKGTWE